MISLTERETLQNKPAGTILFSEGDEPPGIYLIHSGTIELMMQARNGNWKRIRSASPGEILGLESVVSRRPFDSTAHALTPCDLGFIERDSFLRVLDDSPAVRFSVLRLLSRGVNASYDSLRNVAQARA
ncbi:MAG: family transcriptional regulator, cyclic receptor protein [Thermoanaerobaculia bacterium]|nr:family transcriptional regulator, cyclic receptor protein [Thermoanaerobaculia bacterium]